MWKLFSKKHSEVSVNLSFCWKYYRDNLISEGVPVWPATVI